MASGQRGKTTSTGDKLAYFSEVGNSRIGCCRARHPHDQVDSDLGLYVPPGRGSVREQAQVWQPFESGSNSEQLAVQKEQSGVRKEQSGSRKQFWQFWQNKAALDLRRRGRMYSPEPDRQATRRRA